MESFQASGDMLQGRKTGKTRETIEAFEREKIKAI
jgi:hypothetical protein